MTTGTVKKVVADRGFGFIAAEDEKEYFFHRGASIPRSTLIASSAASASQFEIEQSPKGPRAAQVRAA